MPILRHPSRLSFYLPAMTGSESVLCDHSIDYAEEQSMEIEAMQAVFMDDFECEARTSLSDV